MGSPEEVADLAIQLSADAIQRLIAVADDTETLGNTLQALVRRRTDGESVEGLAVSMAIHARSELGAGTTSQVRHADPVRKALDDGDNEEGERLAADLLVQASELGPDHWDYGNLIHNAYLTLGYVRLRQGDLDASEAALRGAGASPGSPQLNSFGPDLSLAWKLMKLGRAEAAKDYFIACSRFWSPMQSRP